MVRKRKPSTKVGKIVETVLTSDQIRQAYRECFSSPSGLTVLQNMRQVFKDRPVFDPRDPNPIRAALVEGERLFVLRIERLISEQEMVDARSDAEPDDPDSE